MTVAEEYTDLDLVFEDDTPHSSFGPSSAERWMKCPGSHSLTKDMPDTETSFAFEGTVAHWVAEMCREHELAPDVFLGKECTSRSGEITVEVDREMVDCVQAFLDYLNQFDGDSYNEQLVRYDDWVEDGFGTSDAIIVPEPLVVVPDLKYGKGVQKWAKDNPQLLLYALGVYQHLGFLYEIENFKLVIFQPRLDHVDEWEVSLEDVLAFGEEAREAQQIALRPDAPLVPGKEQCQFCRARKTCKARAKWLLEAIPDDTAHLSNDAVAQILPVLDGIRAAANDIEDYAMSQVQQGNAVGDYKLVEGRSNRVYKGKDEKSRAAQLRAAYKSAGLKIADIWKKTLVGVGDAEKALGKKHPFFDPEDELCGVYKPPGKPKLAPGDDPRPPLAITAEDEFSELDD